MRKKIGLIPARGGSKGIPRKNIYAINGKPLIAYSIEAGLKAKENGYLDRVIVSTEDEEIADISRKYGAEVPFMRPAELATDKSRSVDCMIHAVEFFRGRGEAYDDMVLLQPTSPLRNAEDIMGAVKTYEKAHTNSLVSCYLEESVSEYNSYHMQGNIGMPLKKEHNLGMRRQDIVPLYVRNGAIFITDIQYMLRTRLVIGENPAIYVMPRERSVNIDTRFDLRLIEFVFAERERNEKESANGCK